MISIYYGEDRVAALSAARRLLGTNHEVIEGENLTSSDLPSIFLGGSLFDAERHILIKELLANKDKQVLENLPHYLDTPHQIVLLEDKLDKRTALYKTLAKIAAFKEFKSTEKTNRNLAFNIYDMALRDGPKAVQMTAELEKNSAAQEVIGAWTWKALQSYKSHPRSNKEQRILYALAELDLKTKQSTSLNSWTLLRAFLLELSQQ